MFASAPKKRFSLFHIKATIKVVSASLFFPRDWDFDSSDKRRTLLATFSSFEIGYPFPPIGLSF